MPAVSVTSSPSKSNNGMSTTSEQQQQQSTSLLPPERKPKRPFLKSRTFAVMEGGAAAGGVGPLVLQSLAALERLDTVCVTLKTISSLQCPVVTQMNASLQKVVAERIDRLGRIFEKLGERGDDIMLRFLPGDLIAELNALIYEKEQQLSAVLKSQQGIDGLPLCEAYLRGTCTNGVTCNYSHDNERLATFVRKWITAALRLPMQQDGEPVPSHLLSASSDASHHEDGFGGDIRNLIHSTDTSMPNTARRLGGGGGGGGSLSPRGGGGGAERNEAAFASHPSSPNKPRSGSANVPIQSVLTVSEPFGPETWYILLNALVDYPNVHSLVLRGPMPTQSIKLVAEMLKKGDLERIYHLDIGRNNIGGAYPQGILRLAKGIMYNSTLTSLDVSFNRLGATGALALFQGICDGGVVECLNIGNNGITIGDAAFEQLCALISKGNLNMLRKLSLNGNRLGGDGAALLINSLAGNDYGSLTHLDLYHTGLGDRGCRALAAFLTSERSSGPNLRLLNVGWNGITAIGVQSLCQALEGHQELQILRLHSNPTMGRKGALAIAQMLKASHGLPLHTLDLRWTSPTDDGVASIAEAVTNTRFLHKLLIDHNDLDSRSEALIVEKLRKRPLVMSVDESVFVPPEDEVW